jgi:hypothetical protein
MLAKTGAGIRFNEHMEGDSEGVFRHACKLGFKGIGLYREGVEPSGSLQKVSDRSLILLFWIYPGAREVSF